ncbi:hypothetical protein K488DRAFT_84362 [Vararia minispora EC-137]|uniref:Uncharacterized protein n=1 Tax=Vararia minispora EC-137 TaxID=1314806 RepID=A0ACB8QR72_9AGAM|nr:hypothetical protein K488DRAFT_84362 [Vararia minispora EC-137]
MSFLSVSRSSLRAAAPLRSASFSLRAPYSRLSRVPIVPAVRPLQSPVLRLVFARSAASTVSSRPGSQTFQHAGQNIKEEVGDAARDMAKAIAGGNLPVDSVKPMNETFLGVTSSVASAVPTPYIVMGLAGGIPYLGSALTSIHLARQAGYATMGLATNIDPGVALTVLDQALMFQATYGAVMLSFLGALHWGMEFSGYGGHKGYSRLMLGAAPVVWAWSTLAFEPSLALILQWVGFTGLWYADLKATTFGWTPKWYSQYRFYLSILVGTCIIATLAGTSYWSPHGAGVLMRELEETRAERKRLHPENRGVIPGNIEATPADETQGSFVLLRKRKVEKDAEDEGQAQNEAQKH